MTKKVRITLEFSSEFVSLLQANVQLQGYLKDGCRKRMDPMAVLSVIVLGEARGATELQILEKTPEEWRPHIAAIHSERRVTEA